MQNLHYIRQRRAKKNTLLRQDQNIFHTTSQKTRSSARPMYRLLFFHYHYFRTSSRCIEINFRCMPAWNSQNTTLWISARQCTPLSAKAIRRNSLAFPTQKRFRPIECCRYACKHGRNASSFMAENLCVHYFYVCNEFDEVRTPCRATIENRFLCFERIVREFISSCTHWFNRL